MNYEYYIRTIEQFKNNNVALRNLINKIYDEYHLTMGEKAALTDMCRDYMKGELGW